MKLLFLSDLHMRTRPRLAKLAMEVVEHENPDFVLLGGDYENLMLFISFLKSIGCSEKRKAIFILGNNDEFEITREINVPGIYLDFDGYVKIQDAVTLVITGFSRNFSIREKYYSITVVEALRRAKMLASSLPEDGLRIVMLHEVPLDLLIAARAVKPGLRFHERIANAAAQVVEILRADIVLVGHMHLPDIPYLAVEKTVGDKVRHYILTTLVNQTYTVIEIDSDRKIRIDVKKASEMKTLITKTLKVS